MQTTVVAYCQSKESISLSNSYEHFAADMEEGMSVEPIMHKSTNVVRRIC